MDCLRAVLAAGLLMLSALCLGLPVSHWGARADNPLAVGARALGFGFLTISYSVLLLGLCGWLKLSVLLVALLLPILVPGRAASAGRLAADSARSFKDQIGRGWAIKVIVLCLFGVVWAALAPNTHFDVSVYHYAFPELYLRHGSLQWTWANVLEGFVQTTHMLYIPAMALGGERAANLLGPAFLVILLAAAMEICERVEGPGAARLIALMLVTSPILLFQSLGGMVDMPSAAYGAMALASLLRSRDDDGHLLWCGLWSGAAVSTKLPALAYVGCLAVAAFASRRGASRLRAAAILAGVLLLGCPWWVRNLCYTGDPISPVQSEWGIHLTPGLGLKWGARVAKPGKVFPSPGPIHVVTGAPAAPLVQEPMMLSPQPNRWSALLEPWRGSRLWQDCLNPLTLAAVFLCPAALFVTGFRPGFRGLGTPVALALPLVVYSWCFQSDLRYCLTALVWLACLSAVLLARVAKQWPKAVNAVMALSLAPGLAVLAGLLIVRGPVALGLRDSEDFLERRGPQAAFQYLHEHGRSGQTVVLLGRVGFRCPLDYLSADFLPKREWSVLSSGPAADYFVLDLRERHQLTGMMNLLGRQHPGQIVALDALLSGPFRSMTRASLEHGLTDYGFTVDSLGRTRLPDPKPWLSPYECVFAEALAGEAVFARDGVEVLVPQKAKRGRRAATNI